MESCRKLQVSERAHPSVVISLVASMARFARHGHPTYSFSNRVSDLIKLRFYRGVDNGCDKRPPNQSLDETFPARGGEGDASKVWKVYVSGERGGMRDNLHPRRDSRSGRDEKE